MCHWTIFYFDGTHLFFAGWVSSNFFYGESQANHGRVSRHMARSCFKKIITRTIYSYRTKFCRLWSPRPLYFPTHSCSVCYCYGSANCISASSTISEKLGNYKRFVLVCYMYDCLLFPWSENLISRFQLMHCLNRTCFGTKSSRPHNSFYLIWSNARE